MLQAVGEGKLVESAATDMGDGMTDKAAEKVEAKPDCDPAGSSCLTLTGWKQFT